MLSARLSSLCLVAFGLVGCASTPAFTTGEDYIRFAETWSATHSCSRSGNLDASTAATGIAIMQTKLKQTRHDAALLQREIGTANKKTWSVEGCRSLAVAIHGWSNQQSSSASSAYEAGKAFTNSMPKQTICNRIGTQTFCSTY